MSNKRDYYEVLGIDKTASDAAIKKAYRKLAKKYHPDSNPGDKAAEQKFKEVTEDYNVLSDAEKKKLYDQFGHAGLDENGPFAHGQYNSQGAGNGTYGYRSPDGSYQEFHFEGGNMDDIFENIFGGSFHRNSSGQRHYSGFTSGFGNTDFNGNDFGRGFTDSGSYRGGFRQKGEDLHAEINISFDDAAFGCEKVIHLQDPHTKAVQNLQVRIPAGISDGKSIRLKGKGMDGIGGGSSGDLLLKVHVGSKLGFERKGDDIYTTARIPFTTAVFGGEVLVHTIDGKVLCSIKPGTQSGSKIRLKGKGIVSMQNPSLHGDHYVTIQIDVPKHLSPQAKQKLKEFEQISREEDPSYKNSRAS